MLIKPKSDLSVKVTLTDNGQAYFIGKDFSEPLNNPQPNIIQQLLNEILRVKELIKQYNTLPESSNHSSVPILNELIAEAYNSLVNYDVVLMNKYYDLLQNCD